MTAEVISSLTSSLGVEGAFKVDAAEFQTYLGHARVLNLCCPRASERRGEASQERLSVA